MLFQNQGIVVACDVSSLEALERLVAATGGVRAVTGFKVGFSLALRHGLPVVVQRIRTCTPKPIVYDHQKAGTDIPQMGVPFAEACAEGGVDAAILFPLAGPATLQAWIEALRQVRLTPIVGAVMTHRRFLASEGGFIRDDAHQEIYRIALASDVVHFVLPATKPEHAAALRAEALAAGVKEPILLSPGVGRQKADIRAVRETFKGLNWSPIVGSAIYGADDPAAEASRMAEELRLGAWE